MIVTGGIETITSLPSPALGFLPAVHDASVDSFPATVAHPDTGEPTANTLPTPAAGSVLQVTEGAISLPAYGSWPAQRALSGQFIASDGRFWFRVRRYQQTNSFYPEVFERMLYSFAFTAVSLPLRQRWALTRDFDFRLFSNNTDAVWNVVWEVGDRFAETSPAPVGPNIEGYQWRTPLIDQQVHITDVLGRHRFEASLYRDVGPDGEFWTGSVARYGKTVAAQTNQLPLSNDFVLRLRLSCFDIENNVSEPRGFVAYYATQPKD
jgi:hypothetical protein